MSKEKALQEVKRRIRIGEPRFHKDIVQVAEAVEVFLKGKKEDKAVNYLDDVIKRGFPYWNKKAVKFAEEIRNMLRKEVAESSIHEAGHITDFMLDKLIKQAESAIKDIRKTDVIRQAKDTQNKALKAEASKLDASLSAIEAKLKSAKSLSNFDDESKRAESKRILAAITKDLKSKLVLAKKIAKDSAAAKSKEEVDSVNKKWDEKKKDFKARVKENLKQKRRGKVDKIRSKFGKMKDKINFTTD